jgi:hypothetical protein
VPLSAYARQLTAPDARAPITAAASHHWHLDPVTHFEQLHAIIAASGRKIIAADKSILQMRSTLAAKLREHDPACAARHCGSSAYQRGRGTWRVADCILASQSAVCHGPSGTGHWNGTAAGGNATPGSCGICFNGICLTSIIVTFYNKLDVRIQSGWTLFCEDKRVYAAIVARKTQFGGTGVRSGLHNLSLLRSTQKSAVWPEMLLVETVRLR